MLRQPEIGRTFTVPQDWMTLSFWTLNVPATLTVGFTRQGETVMKPRLGEAVVTFIGARPSNRQKFKMVFKSSYLQVHMMFLLCCFDQCLLDTCPFTVHLELGTFDMHRAPRKDIASWFTGWSSGVVPECPNQLPLTWSTIIGLPEFDGKKRMEID